MVVVSVFVVNGGARYQCLGLLARAWRQPNTHIMITPGPRPCSWCPPGGQHGHQPATHMSQPRSIKTSPATLCIKTTHDMLLLLLTYMPCRENKNSSNKNRSSGRRARAKSRQTAASSSKLPSIIVVVSHPIVIVIEKCKPPAIPALLPCEFTHGSGACRVWWRELGVAG